MKIIVTKFNSKPSQFIYFYHGNKDVRPLIWIEFWWFNKTIQITIIL
jgi:hypothetical protein